MKTKTCPVCRVKFAPSRPMQKVCSPACAYEYSRKQAVKSEMVQALADRKTIKLRKDAIKTIRDWTKEAQIAWNFYVRMRDYGKPCASCGAMPEQKYGGTMDCSHYRSVGAAPHLRFHLHNAAAACVRCNRHLSGNIAALRVGMIERIGIDKVEAIESNNGFRKFDIPYLKRIKDIFTKKGNIVARRVGVR